MNSFYKSIERYNMFFNLCYDYDAYYYHDDSYDVY